MKIPKKLQIAGRTVDIRINGKIASESQVNGLCSADRQYILLDDPKASGVSEEMIQQTLIHEVIHFCNNILCREDCNTESYVNPLSELLYQVFKQIENK